MKKLIDNSSRLASLRLSEHAARSAFACNFDLPHHQPNSFMTFISNSLIFLRNVFRFSPNKSAARI